MAFLVRQAAYADALGVFLSCESSGSQLDWFNARFRRLVAILDQDGTLQVLLPSLLLLFRGLWNLPIFRCGHQSTAELDSTTTAHIVDPILMLPLTGLHLTLFHNAEPCASLQCVGDGTSGLVLAAAHRSYDILHDNIAQVQDLDDHQRDTILSALIDMNTKHLLCRGWGMSSSDKHERLQFAFDTILDYNKTLNASHIAMACQIGPESLRRFHRRLSKHTEPIGNDIVPAISWFQSYDVFMRVPALFLWIIPRSYHAGVDLEHSIAASLQLLLDLGANIHAIHPSTGDDIVAFLLRTTFGIHPELAHRGSISYNTSWVDECAIRLYVLEHCNASFEQALSLAVHEKENWTRLVSTLAPRHNPFQPYIVSSLEDTLYLLDHKQAFGHLPQPAFSWPRLDLEKRRRICETCERQAVASLEVSTVNSLYSLIEAGALRLASQTDESDVPRLWLDEGQSMTQMKDELTSHAYIETMRLLGLPR